MPAGFKEEHKAFWRKVGKSKVCEEERKRVGKSHGLSLKIDRTDMDFLISRSSSSVGKKKYSDLVEVAIWNII